MYAATLRDAEESRAANASIRKERDEAVAERDEAVAERDEAVAERDEAVAERDEAVAERDMYRSVAARVPQLEAMVAQRDARIARMQQDLDHLVKVARRYVTGKVVYPAGPNEPPSEQNARRQGGEGGAEDGGVWTPPRSQPRRTRVPKKPGGRKDHRGAGPSYRPTDAAFHRFTRGPDGGIIAAPCQCGQCGGRGGGGSCGWRPDGFRPRIIRDIEYNVVDTLHYTEAAGSECGGSSWPVTTPPVGAHGKNLLGLVSELRARALPYDAIAGIVNAMAGRHVIARASVIAAYNRTADSLRTESERRMDNARKSRTAGADETHALEVYMRLTAAYVEHLLVVEYIRTSLGTMAGESACAALRAVEEDGCDDCGAA